MKTIKKRWTKEEDEILVQAIKDNFYNKSQTFREVALKINHSKNSCSIRWYKYLSNPYSKHYIGCCFLTIGRESTLNNRTLNRQCTIIKPTKSSLTIWNKIKKFLGL